MQNGLAAKSPAFGKKRLAAVNPKKRPKTDVPETILSAAEAGDGSRTEYWRTGDGNTENEALRECVELPGLTYHVNLTMIF